MKQKRPNKLTEQVREAIATCGKTRYQISKDTGIDAATLCRFMGGKGGLSNPILDTLGEYLGLEIDNERQVKHGDRVQARRAKRQGRVPLSYTDHRGLRKTRSAKTTDLDAARRIANKLESDAALRRDGVVDPRLEALGEQSRRTIEEHLADFKAKLSAAGASADHLTRTCRFIRDAAEAAGFEAAGDITADKVNHYGAELLKKMAARSVAARLTAVKSFTRWLAAEGKLPADPLASVKKPGARPTGAWSVECSCPTNGNGCGLSHWPTMPHATECRRTSGYCSTLRQSKRGCGRTNCAA